MPANPGPEAEQSGDICFGVGQCQDTSSLVVYSKDYSSSSPRAQAQRACALRALGLLMANGVGDDFLARRPLFSFFTKASTIISRVLR